MRSRAKKRLQEPMLGPVLAEVLSETWGIRRRLVIRVRPRASGLDDLPRYVPARSRGRWYPWWKGLETEFPSNEDVLLTTPEARGPKLRA